MFGVRSLLDELLREDRAENVRPTPLAKRTELLSLP
jgi:hypothetical protein